MKLGAWETSLGAWNWGEGVCPDAFPTGCYVRGWPTRAETELVFFLVRLAQPPTAGMARA